MSKEELARELLLGEMDKEQGRFITQRIIDRLALLYAPMFERTFLAGIAETVNSEGQRKKNTACASEKKCEQPVSGGFLPDLLPTG